MTRPIQRSISTAPLMGSSHDVELYDLPLSTSGQANERVRAHTEALLDSETVYIPMQADSTQDAFPAGTKTGLRLRRPKSYDPMYPDTGDTKTSDQITRGWRKSVVAAAGLTGLVLLINVCFMVYALTRHDVADGVGLLRVGNCRQVSQWNTALHLLINVLSTIVLGASNFTMQCLSSPTRDEVDVAHGKRISLDVGIASVKNLRHMSKWKATLWTLLCFSTLPLHLLWNSTIFTVHGTNAFSYLVAVEDFLHGASYQTPHQPDEQEWDCKDIPPNIIASLYDGYQNGSFEKLSPRQCISDYVEANNMDMRRNVIIIVQPPALGINITTCGYGGQLWNGSAVIAMDIDQYPFEVWYSKFYFGYEQVYLTQSEGIEIVKSHISSDGTWALGNLTVESCWSEINYESPCQLQFASFVLYAVVLCNAIKFVCMCLTTKWLWNLNHPILATVGDATASFLRNQDDTTLKWCLLNRKSVRAWQSTQTSDGHETRYQRPSRRLLYSATSPLRWWLTITICTLYLILGFLLFDLSLELVRNRSDISTGFMGLGFGIVNSSVVLGLAGESGGKLLQDILVANSFQLALSTTYFLYNSLFSAQCGALEWATYARGKRKSLRVTQPTGQQRSTYYLQLPYRYGIPLIVLSATMHFLISQSIFLARIVEVDSTGHRFSSVSDVGFSPEATLITCCVGSAMILTQILHSFRPLDNRIPIHGNNSAVISAMCHSSDDQGLGSVREGLEDDIAAAPIMWGVTRQPREYDEGSTIQETPGHCGFSTDVVELPQVDDEHGDVSPTVEIDIYHEGSPQTFHRRM